MAYERAWRANEKTSIRPPEAGSPAVTQYIRMWNVFYSASISVHLVFLIQMKMAALLSELNPHSYFIDSYTITFNYLD